MRKASKEERLKKTVHSTVGERIKKNQGNKFGWLRNLKRGEVKFDKPVMLFLPGNATNDDKDANGGVKELIRAMGRVGVEDNDIQMLAAYYPEEYRKTFANSKIYLKERNEDFGEEYKNPKYVKDIYDAIIRPVLFKNSRGEKQNSEIIAKKLRNLTIVSHCFGSFTATMLMENLYKDMQNLRFNENEIKQCMEEVVNIAISPKIGYHKNNKNVLTIGFSALNDSLSDYSYVGLLDSIYCDDVANSSMDVGLISEDEHKLYIYLCGDTYNYVYGKPFMSYSEEMHTFQDYTDEDSEFYYRGEEGIDGFVHKNKKGRNFSRLICRMFQNAVSLSFMGEKRTIDRIVSNDTPVVFKQGEKVDNKKTVPVVFDGNNAVFKKVCKEQFEKVRKIKELEEATKKIEKKQNNVDSTVKLPLNER